MKTETVLEEVKIFICSCGERSQFQSKIDQCELRHKQAACPHDRIWTYAGTPQDGEYEYEMSILKVCKDCQKVVDRVSMKTTMDEDKCQAIYEAIKAFEGGEKFAGAAS